MTQTQNAELEPDQEPTAGVPDRLIAAAVALLAEQGPSAVKARAVASAAGMSTMVVYSHFGGIPELLQAVADHGFDSLRETFAEVPVTDDPVADLFTMALACRRFAAANPHVYDLMFGLSTRATYRPPTKDRTTSGQSPAFRAAYAHLIEACARLVHSDRARLADPTPVAAALWSCVHGFVTLELAEHFVEFDDPVKQVLLPMGVAFSAGLGDPQDRAERSHEAALSRWLHSQRCD